ncbi:RidA family protein [Roseisolibacter agri]|uniref:Enamine deaminase RidA n=1 Tax=Roseisolibacter agri TaxID=2014610 RepID=A0AA37QG74_9BACT|nr:RidA family protein [Roseisolibacter agri]GLC25208.1 enamine deaminase RidA [Roseisolibacter agri]
MSVERAASSVEGRVVRPEGWPRPHGYADGVVAEGRVLSISGQIGWDPVTCTFATDDFAEQTAQALRNVVAVLRAGGAGPEHLVRLTWYVTDRAAYVAARRAIGAAYRATIGAHYPAMSVVVVAGLLEERALVEIEATAVVPA